MSSHTASSLSQLRRAVNQWLDAPDDQVSAPAFVLGCQRSGTSLIADLLGSLPQSWCWPEHNSIAYEAFRLRSPATVALLTRLTPARLVVFKPVCDAHLGDRILDAHPDARAVWVVRGWRAVAQSCVDKWGSHHKDVLLKLARNEGADVSWRGERIPDAIQAQITALATDDMPDEAGAALFWYLRNTFYFSLALDADPRVTLLRYDDLVRDPVATLAPVLAHLGADAGQAETLAAKVERRETAAALPAMDERIVALCDALQAKF